MSRVFFFLRARFQRSGSGTNTSPPKSSLGTSGVMSAYSTTGASCPGANATSTVNFPVPNDVSKTHHVHGRISRSCNSVSNRSCGQKTSDDSVSTLIASSTQVVWGVLLLLAVPQSRSVYAPPLRLSSGGGGWQETVQFLSRIMQRYKCSSAFVIHFHFQKGYPRSLCYGITKDCYSEKEVIETPYFPPFQSPTQPRRTKGSGTLECSISHFFPRRGSGMEPRPPKRRPAVECSRRRRRCWRPPRRPTTTTPQRQTSGGTRPPWTRCTNQEGAKRVPVL